ncbi:MAG TPA: recombinase family protein, partial [Rickettsiales bacterium]|nr:recombinase family protein [Rickettsiales bacterium]
IDIEIATQNFDRSTSIGRFSFGMMLNFAQLEREMASDRIKDKIRRQQSLGMWTGGNIPIGYDVIDKKLIINEKESKIVKLIFNIFIKTESINEVINMLNEHDYKTKTRLSKQISQQASQQQTLEQIPQQQKTRDGKNFSRHAVYKVLKNKIYIGKIENKTINKIFDGIHEAIIDGNTFNEVNEIIENNINEKIYNVVEMNNINNNNLNDANNTNYINNTTDNNKINNNVKSKRYFPKKDSLTPYLLRGLMKCDCCNSILTPVYTVKQKTGIVYRYYKSNKAMKHSTECNLGNVPANQIENIILNQVYAVLKSPSIVSRVISKLVGDKSSNNQTINIDEPTIIKYLQNIEVVWNELFPKEQMQIVNTIIKEIIVSKTNIKIVFNNNGVLKLLADAGQVDIKTLSEFNDNCYNNSNKSIENYESNENNGNNESNKNNNINNKNYEMNIPINFIHRSSRSFITTPDGKDISFVNAETKKTTIQSKRDNAILFTLLQAESWKDELMNNNNNANSKNYNNAIKISHIAKRENKETSYVARVLNLVFLAPDIKKAILSGYAPIGLTLSD